MIRRHADLLEEPRENIRGGQGRAVARAILGTEDMAGVHAVSELTLEPGASIGEHQHTDTEELYVILAGTGHGSLDGVRFPVGPGDSWVTRSGHSHGLTNGPTAPLTFLAVMTRATTP